MSERAGNGVVSVTINAGNLSNVVANYLSAVVLVCEGVTVNNKNYGMCICVIVELASRPIRICYVDLEGNDFPRIESHFIGKVIVKLILLAIKCEGCNCIGVSAYNSCRVVCVGDLKSLGKVKKLNLDEISVSVCELVRVPLHLGEIKVCLVNCVGNLNILKSGYYNVSFIGMNEAYCNLVLACILDLVALSLTVYGKYRSYALRKSSKKLKKLGGIYNRTVVGILCSSPALNKIADVNSCRNNGNGLLYSVLSKNVIILAVCKCNNNSPVSKTGNGVILYTVLEVSNNVCYTLRKIFKLNVESVRNLDIEVELCIGYIYRYLCGKNCIVVGHLSKLVAVLIVPTDDLLVVVSEECKVCACRKESGMDEIAVLGSELNLSDTLYVNCNVKSDVVISDVITNKHIEDIRIVGIILCKLADKLLVILNYGKSMCAGVVELTLCIVKISKYAHEAVVHESLGNSCYCVVYYYIDILLCKAEVTLVLLNESVDLIIGKSGKVNVSAKKLAIKESLIVNRLKNLDDLFCCKIVVKSIKRVAVCFFKCCEYLVLEAIGEHIALCCSEHEICEVVGDVDVEIKHAAYIAYVYVVSDNACEHSHFIVTAAKLTGEGKRYVAERGVYFYRVGELHLVVCHIRDFVGSGKLKCELLESGKVQCRTYYVLIYYVSVDCYVINRSDKCEYKCLLVKTADKRINVESTLYLCLCLVEEILVSAGENRLNRIDSKLGNLAAVVLCVCANDICYCRLGGCEVDSVYICQYLCICEVNNLLCYTCIFAEKPLLIFCYKRFDLIACYLILK